MKPVERCKAIRRRILEVSMKARSAHAGSALSCVEILDALFDWKTQPAPSPSGKLEKIIFSKGHAAMALYATAELFGMLDHTELDSYLKTDTRLWGHPSRHSHPEFIDWSTGSLGHGLPVAVGFAYSRLKLAQVHEQKVCAVLSDGECDEGSVWEAALFGGHHKLSNMIAIIDYNKIQSFGRCSDVMSLEPFAAKWQSFGWDVREIDGHDPDAIRAALHAAPTTGPKPLCIIAHTVKGKGYFRLENQLLSHYQPAKLGDCEAFDEK